MAAFQVPPVDYTSRDFESIRDDMIRLIPFFTSEWTDHNPSDFGIVLVELCAAHFDALHFYVDRMAGESFLSTAIKRESVVDLLALIDYQIPSAQAAVVDLEFVIAAQVGSVTIPEGFQIKTKGTESLFFETTEDLVILAAQTQGTVGAVEGQSISDNPVGISNGTAFQPFELSQSPVLDTPISVFVDEGSGFELWTRVDSFVDSEATDKVYRTSRDAEEKITIVFGDDAQGKIPANLSPIRVDYRIGGGLRGNIGANTITVLVDQVLFLGSPIPASVNNPASAAGGEDRQSTEDAKVQGPRQLRALNRAVTLEDYEILSENFPGVEKVKAILDSVTKEITVRVFPTGGGAVPAQLITDLTDFLQARACAGSIVIVTGAVLIQVQLVADFRLFPNFLTASVEAAVDLAIDEYFDPTGEFMDFGKTLFLSDIFRKLDEVDGVDNVDIVGWFLDPNTTIQLLVWAGEVDFSTIVLSATTLEEIWTVVWTSPTTFTVTGSASGLQTNTGTIGVAYVSDNAEVSFTLAATGPTPPVALDSATFRTSKFFGNVNILPEEFAERGLDTLTFTGGA